ncbi:hypothetical protein AK812_SmicGene17910 [Symbiodinium microadriaticum]|uniref:EF-hand domain-containing protein n=1 Tax=Symbiodinium microadriaticum TaxID=2951 RepID=A0A1Q9DWH6_SYMMI|nr:hypothetical protein AK812_SmicGene17910 [Symbiodinium microadriaticum]
MRVRFFWSELSSLLLDAPCSSIALRRAIRDVLYRTHAVAIFPKSGVETVGRRPPPDLWDDECYDVMVGRNAAWRRWCRECTAEVARGIGLFSFADITKGIEADFMQVQGMLKRARYEQRTANRRDHSFKTSGAPPPAVPHAGAALCQRALREHAGMIVVLDIITSTYESWRLSNQRSKRPPFPVCRRLSWLPVVPSVRTTFDTSSNAPRKDALRLQQKLKKQERARLDFHGLAGDVRGFLAFMTHKYGSFCRGWRKDVATDEMGVANVLQSDFFHAMRKIGYTGQLLTLWKELTHNEKESCWLADLDPKLSRGLDQLASGLWKVYRRGTQQAWEDIPRAWLTRMNFEEFLAWMNEQAIARSRGFAVSERQLFDVLDIKGIGTVTLKEFRFLDYWAHKRLKKPLPPDEAPPEPPTSPKSEPRHMAVVHAAYSRR